MRSLLSRVLCALALPSLLAGFAACSSEDREKASIGALSASDRQDMTESSMGGFQFSLVAFASVPLPSLSCPMISITGTTTTIAGNGCVDDSGVKWNGKLIAAVNSSGVAIQLDLFSLSDTTDASNTVTVEGEITAAAGGTIKSDVVITVDQKEISHEGAWTALTEHSGSISSDSSVELEGKGYVDISGQWNLESKTGAIEMEGEETLRVDFATYVAATGCANATVDGVADGTVCLDAEASTLRPSPITFFSNALDRSSRTR